MDYHMTSEFRAVLRRRDIDHAAKLVWGYLEDVRLGREDCGTSSAEDIAEFCGMPPAVVERALADLRNVGLID